SIVYSQSEPSIRISGPRSSKYETVITKRQFRRQVKRAVEKDIETVLGAQEEIRIKKYLIKKVPTVENIELINYKASRIPDYDLVEYNVETNQCVKRTISNFVNEDLETTENKKSKTEVNFQLRNWAVEENISHKAVGRLLHVLHDHLPELPLSSRTLLGTNRSSNIQNIPVAGSWLFFAGNQKPKCLKSYLLEFTDELKYISDNGLYCQGISYGLNLQKCSFILDSPARAFVKSIKGHMGYYSCEKCVTKGSYEPS
ncbi:unnamed protein product, partial [Allacma fusca]